VTVIYTPDFWVAVAFVIFFIIVWWAGAFGAIASSLDSRSARIRKELDDARSLREEADKLLAEYKKTRSEAEKEAAAIVAAAKSEAEEMTAEAQKRTEEFVVRRTKVAETKIAQAEAQALADVRAAAAETAVRAAERVLTESVKGKVADDLIAGAIKDVKSRLD
jgi:F-type H+-transporting ATPase subunit b